MTERIICRRCSSMIPSGHRYKIVVTLQQSADMLEIMPTDLESDFIAEMEKTIEELSAMDPKKIEEDIHVSFQACLCKNCRDILVERLKTASDMAHTGGTH